GAAAAPAAPPPDAAARVNATSKLAAAMGANAAMRGLDPGLVQQLATAVEADVYGSGGLPRQQYTSRMAGLISRAKAAPSPVVLLPPTHAETHGSLLPALLQAEVSAIESLLEQHQQQAAGGNSSNPSSSPSGAPPAVAQAVARLRAMAAVAVTVGAVAAGGVGKRVNK
ncbi:hypothetical protein Agub_g12463, partial [Astrephomene gubernaculifera]